MIYELVANGKIVDTADNVQELDYSKIHHCTRWFVNTVSNDTIDTIVDVDWSPAEKYSIYLANTQVDTIFCHNEIIPTVKAALMVWNWVSDIVDKIITIRPCGS